MKKTIFITAAVGAMCLEAAAAQDATELNPIVVNAGADRVASDVPQSVSVINQEALDDIQAGTIGDILGTLPGFSGVGSDSIFGQSFNIRGVGAGLDAAESSILTLVDGEEVYYESYRQGSLFVEPELLKRVEVLRGPGSSTLYGSGAMGGVILMETKDATDFLVDGDTFAVRQKLSYESNPDKAQSTTILAFQPNQNFDALLAFTYSDIGESEDGNGTRLIRSNADIYNILAKANYYTGPHRIGFSYQQFEANGKNQDFNQLNGPQVGLFPGFTGWGVGNITTRSQVAKLEYGYAPEDNRFIDLTATLSYTNALKDIKQGTVAAEPVFASLLNERAYGLWKVKVENVADISAGSMMHYLTFGVAFSTQNRTSNPPSTSQAEGDTKTYEIYALSELSITDRLTINTGLRIDHQNIVPGDTVTGTPGATSETAIEPQIAMIYKLTKQWNVFGSVAHVNRLPTVDEIFDTRGLGLPNLALRPEVGNNVEMGASFSGADVFGNGDEVDFKITGFHNKINDKIVRGPLIPGTVSFTNVDEATIKGLEIEGGYAIDKFGLNAGVTIISGKDGTGTEINTLANNSLKLGLSFQATPEFRIGSRSTFALSRSRIRTDGTTIDSFNVHNIYAAYKPKNGPLKGAEIRLGIDNLFNTVYRPATYEINAKGRNLKISIAKTF